MQSVFNSVKGTALGVAEYLTPVLKVSMIRIGWKSHLALTISWHRSRQWENDIGDWGMEMSTYCPIQWKCNDWNDRKFKFCLMGFFFKFIYLFILFIWSRRRNRSSVRLAYWRRKNSLRPATIWCITVRHGNGPLATKRASKHICQKISNF